MKRRSGKRIEEPASSKKGSSIQRRDFLKYLGGGILIVFAPIRACRNMSEPVQASNALPTDFNAFLHIAEDGTVTCFTGKVEMGQGPMIALAQMMADELDVAFENVKMVM